MMPLGVLLHPHLFLLLIFTFFLSSHEIFYSYTYDFTFHYYFQFKKKYFNRSTLHSYKMLAIKQLLETFLIFIVCQSKHGFSNASKPGTFQFLPDIILYQYITPSNMSNPTFPLFLIFIAFPFHMVLFRKNNFEYLIKQTSKKLCVQKGHIIPVTCSL